MKIFHSSQQLHLSRQGLVGMRPTIPISQLVPWPLRTSRTSTSTTMLLPYSKWLGHKLKNGWKCLQDSSIKLILTAKNHNNSLTVAIAHTITMWLMGWLINSIWHNLTNTIVKVSWLIQTLVVFVTWLIKVNLLIWIRLSLSWLTTIVRLVTSLVLKMLQRNASSILKIVRLSLTILSARKRLIRVPMEIGVSFLISRMQISVLLHLTMRVPTLQVRMPLVM